MKQFTEKFDEYVCANDSISVDVDGFTIEARIVYDEDYRLDDDDMHNIDQSVTGCNDEQHAKLMRAREAWLNDEWFYCSVVMSVSKNGIMLNDHAASLWGIECNYPDSDNSHLNDIANELIYDAVVCGQQALSKLID